VFIEYRSRLKTFDLIYMPNLGKAFGAAQYVNQLKFRDSDFIKLCAIIVKANEYYARSEWPFSKCISIAVAEAEAALYNGLTPAQSTLSATITA
jgi:hypothetical protein